jgi:predicted phosphodiesterase
MAKIVARKPDLVIHVGDYIYRNSPCPPPHDCLGSPHGDNLQTWVADWFGPAQQLLSQAPFVFVRGNHETCSRGAAKGWFRYLAIGSPPAKCPVASEPWKAQLADLDLIVFDASAGPASHSSLDQLPAYKRMADAIFATLQRETWFLTHRPLWVHMRAFGETINGDDTQREAFGAAMPQAVSLVLSGHIHAFQALDMAHGPAQVISGNGGTKLDPMPTGMERNFEVAGSLARQIVNDGGFGFLMLTRTDQREWHMDVLDAKGVRQRRCHLSGRDLSCAARLQ